MKGAGIRGLVRAGILGALVASAGCLKIDSTVELNTDGSGKWRLKYAMPQHMIRQVDYARELARDLEQAGTTGVASRVQEPLDLPLIFDETRIKERFRPLLAQGIRLKSLQVKSMSGWQHVDLTIQFDRFETLMKLPFLAECGAALKKQADGTFMLILQAPDLSGGGSLPDASDPFVAANLSPFLSGMSVVSRVEIPTAIRRTNSAVSDARRGTWEWDVDKDLKTIERLDKAQMILVFDGDRVNIREFEKLPRMGGAR